MISCFCCLASSISPLVAHHHTKDAAKKHTNILMLHLIISYIWLNIICELNDALSERKVMKHNKGSSNELLYFCICHTILWHYAKCAASSRSSTAAVNPNEAEMCRSAVFRCLHPLSILSHTICKDAVVFLDSTVTGLSRVERKCDN